MFHSDHLLSDSDLAWERASPAPSNGSDRMDVDSDVDWDSDMMSVDSEGATGAEVGPNVEARVDEETGAELHTNADELDAHEMDWVLDTPEAYESLEAWLGLIDYGGVDDSEFLGAAISSAYAETPATESALELALSASASSLDPPPTSSHASTAVVQQPIAIADRLPTELLEILFTFLDLGLLRKEYLSACSRVSRRWRAISVPHLFRAVRVRFHVDPPRNPTRKRGTSRRRRDPAAMVQPRERPVHKTLRNMRKFFTDNHEFAACVRELQLVLICPESPSGGEGPDSPQRTYPLADADELLLALLAFPHLTQVKFYDVAVRGCPSVSRPRPVEMHSLRVQFPSRSKDTADLDNYIPIFCLFDAVDELWIGSFRTQSPRRKISAPSLKRLRVVHIEPTVQHVHNSLLRMVMKSPTLMHIECSFFDETHKPYTDYAPKIHGESKPCVRTVVMNHNNLQHLREAKCSFLKILGESAPEVPIAVFFVNNSSETSVSHEKDVRTVATAALEHLRSLAATTRLPGVTHHMIWCDQLSKRIRVRSYELPWHKKGSTQPFRLTEPGFKARVAEAEANMKDASILMRGLKVDADIVKSDRPPMAWP